jgi:flagellar basal-body rod protein FlgB
MQITTPLSNELSKFLDLNARQIEVTTANMANIDTPGYRTVGLDFEAEIQRVLAYADQAEFERGAIDAGPTMHVVDGLIVRPDGNNVSMDRESLNLAQAQLKFKLGVSLLKSQYSEIMNAIHADAR